MKKLVYVLLAALYVVHTDVWLWNDPSLVLGMPVGLAYHVGFMLVTAGVLWLAVRYAWPAHLESEIEDEQA